MLKVTNNRYVTQQITNTDIQNPYQYKKTKTLNPC
jgi:hypothetical protein